jgi:hypothetical protein
MVRNIETALGGIIAPAKKEDIRKSKGGRPRVVEGIR